MTYGMSIVKYPTIKENNLFLGIGLGERREHRGIVVEKKKGLLNGLLLTTYRLNTKQ